jgi:hypothetical protein
MSGTISVFGVREDELAPADAADAPDVAQPRFVEVPTDHLREELAGFLEGMTGVVEGLPGEIGEFGVTSLALNLAVTATGKISLFGIGGELAGTAGLTVTLQRRP